MVVEIPEDVQTLPCVFALLTGPVDFVEETTRFLHYFGDLLVPTCQIAVLLPGCTLIADVFVMDVDEVIEFGLCLLSLLLL